MEKKLRLQVLIGLSLAVLILGIDFVLSLGDFDDEKNNVKCHVSFTGKTECIEKDGQTKAYCEQFQQCQGKRAITIFDLVGCVIGISSLILFILAIMIKKPSDGIVKFFRKIITVLVLIDIVFVWIHYSYYYKFEDKNAFEAYVSPFLESLAILCLVWVSVLLIKSLWQEYKDEKNVIMKRLNQVDLLN